MYTSRCRSRFSRFEQLSIRGMAVPWAHALRWAEASVRHAPPSSTCSLSLHRQPPGIREIGNADCINHAKTQESVHRTMLMTRAALSLSYHQYQSASALATMCAACHTWSPLMLRVSTQGSALRQRLLRQRRPPHPRLRRRAAQVPRPPSQVRTRVRDANAERRSHARAKAEANNSCDCTC